MYITVLIYMIPIWSSG